MGCGGHPGGRVSRLGKDVANHRRPSIRLRLGFASVLILLLYPLGWPYVSVQAGGSQPPEQQFTFVPQVTPLNLTVTPQPTVPVTVQLQATPMPLAPEAVGTPAPPISISGGDSTVGYDFVEGADVPTWRIWFEGESIIITVRPDDAAMGTLLSAFQLEASERVAAKANSDSARTTLLVSAATLGVGFVGAVGGVAVAIPS